MEAGNN